MQFKIPRIISDERKVLIKELDQTTKTFHHSPEDSRVSRMKRPPRRINDITPEETTLPFKAFISHVFATLSHLKISKNSNSSSLINLIDTCATTCLITLNFLLIISEAMDVKNSYDLPSFAVRLNPILFHCQGFIKWTYCLTHYVEIQEIIDSMEICHEMCQKIDRNDKGTSRYEIKMADCQKNSVAFVNVWMMVCVFGVVQWCANPIIYDLYDDLYGVKNINSTFTRHLPYPGIFPWAVNGFKMYLITFTFQFVGGIGAGIGIGAYDILSITFIMYTCSYLEYLNETLTKEIVNRSVECVMKLLSTAEYWSGINIELFFYCYFGTKIQELGSRLSDAFYCCNWELITGDYESNRLGINKMVVLGIMRAQRPMEMAGGPFYILSLETFRALISLSLSNAIILRQLSN